MGGSGISHALVGAGKNRDGGKTRTAAALTNGSLCRQKRMPPTHSRFGVKSALALSCCVGKPECGRAPETRQPKVRKPNEPMPPLDVTMRMFPARMADDDRKRKGEGGPGTAVITKTKPQTKRPNLYRVLLLNDDYTPMEFVVHVLERFFNKDHESAHRIMMHVHQHGIGECGIFTYEVAETKVTQVMDFARKHQHPLQCIMEKK
jgi:ATP-dependent Clp protease adaptor protein ClpS